jgi:hypothetical protein
MPVCLYSYIYGMANRNENERVCVMAIVCGWVRRMRIHVCTQSSGPCDGDDRYHVTPHDAMMMPAQLNVCSMFIIGSRLDQNSIPDELHLAIDIHRQRPASYNLVMTLSMKDCFLRFRAPRAAISRIIKTLLSKNCLAFVNAHRFI